MHYSHMALVADRDAFFFIAVSARVARWGDAAWESVGCRLASAQGLRHVRHVFHPRLIGPLYLASLVKPRTYLIDGF